MDSSTIALAKNSFFSYCLNVLVTLKLTTSIPLFFLAIVKRGNHARARAKIDSREETRRAKGNERTTDRTFEQCALLSQGKILIGSLLEIQR